MAARSHPFLSFAAFAALPILSACDRSPPPPPEALGEQGSSLSGDTSSVRVSGSSALQPLLNAAKERFEVRHAGTSVEVSAGGSKKGLSDVASNAVHIGASDIFCAPDQRATLVDHKVAVIGFAAMANRGPYNEAIKAMTLEQLAGIFGGRIHNWQELGGADQPIVVINRPPGSGTRTVFGGIVLGGDHFVESKTEDNSGALVDKLKQTTGAISYLALSFKNDALLTVNLRQGETVVEPGDLSIATGQYPLWAYEHLYTRADAPSAALDFVSYVLSADFQRDVLPTVKGFIPVRIMRVQKETD